MSRPSEAIKLLAETVFPALLACSLFAAPPGLAQSSTSEQPLESRPVRTTTPDYTAEREDENVARLLSILARYRADLQASKELGPTAQEITLRKATKKDADALAHIPFSVDKIRLSGAEGNTALVRINQRLSDSKIPQSRRDLTRICTVKTRLYGVLLSSEQRGLNPVGKHTYVAKLHLQPGDTSIQIGDDQWEVKLPEGIGSMNYLLTFYTPPEGNPEFHIFSIPDLLAQDKPYIPAWLPPEFKLTPPAG